MRKYECMMIVDPSISDADRASLLTEVKAELQANGAEKLSEDAWGVRKLAYKINASETGFYVLYAFESEGRGGFFQVTKDFNLRKQIWRHMFVRLDD